MAIAGPRSRALLPTEDILLAFADWSAPNTGGPAHKEISLLIELHVHQWQRLDDLAHQLWHGGELHSWRPAPDVRTPEPRFYFSSLEAPPSLGDVLAETKPISWTLTWSGRARLTHWTDHSRVTVGALLRSKKAGLLAGNPRVILVSRAGGVGGGGGVGFDLVVWLQELGISLVPSWPRLVQGLLDSFLVACAGLFARSVIRVPGRIKARMVARKWEASHGVENATAIRALLDAKTPNEWTPREVSRRLGIHPRSSRQLLTSLGYVQIPGAKWRIGEGAETIARRRAWIAKENRLR